MHMSAINAQNMQGRKFLTDERSFTVFAPVSVQKSVIAD